MYVVNSLKMKLAEKCPQASIPSRKCHHHMKQETILNSEPIVTLPLLHELAFTLLIFPPGDKSTWLCGSVG